LPGGTITQPGRNCWCRASARRARLLVDGQRYFEAFVEAARQARHSLYIAGWDLHPDLRLIREGARRGLRLAPFLDELARTRPELHIHILLWDFSALYLFERETLASLQARRFDERTHERVRLVLDDAHPLGAAQHQKLVVVDDRVAFSGGMDLGENRWDTRAHEPGDPRRRDPRGRGFAPFHDVQILVEGAPARVLGDLFRHRWRRATGGQLAAPPAPDGEREARAGDSDETCFGDTAEARAAFPKESRSGKPDPARAVDPTEQQLPQDPSPDRFSSLWPDSDGSDESDDPDDSEEPRAPWFRHVPCAIARTLPEWNGQAEVREIEALYRDAFRAAEHTIYLENQYFTSPALAAVLAERLREPDGPEVVLVTPLHLAGWLEEYTLGVRRRRVLGELREADRHDRLRICYPRNADGDAIYVHAKVAVIDDRLLQVGSANISNRSLGFDSECDLALEPAADDSASRRAILRQRDDLLAEHLGVGSARVSRAVAREGLVAALDRLSAEGENGGDGSGGGKEPPRRLEPLSTRELGDAPMDVELDLGLADPERPVAAEEFFKVMRWQEPLRRRWRAAIPLAGALLWTVVLALLWRYTSLGQWLHGEAAAVGTSAGAGLRGLGISLGVFVLGGLLVVPVTLLVVLAVGLYGPWLGMLYTLVGMAASTALVHVIGRTLLRRAATELVTPERAARIERRVEQQSVLVFAALRLVPTAPFSLVNLVAGALDAPLGRFVAGTLLGSLLPVAAIALLVDRAAAALQRPWWLNIALVVLLAVVVGLGLRWLRRRLTA
jgi:phosphatidylserine/phosphatidylglycerophosphate/cardiolipin synthase-like enzyme/uncharacterized membrane protein YdjX (TVP38/TMEM64 family)